MSNENEAGGGLAAWRKTERWREQGATDIFPTKSALDWFLRQHGSELIAAGHLIPGIGRRGSLVGPGIDGAVIEILRRAAGRPALDVQALQEQREKRDRSARETTVRLMLGSA